MSGIRNKRKLDDIKSKLKFDGKNNIAFCIKINKNEIVSRIHARLANKQISIGRVSMAFNHILCIEIKKSISDFLLTYNCMPEDVVYQCDSDCTQIARTGKLRCADPDIAHMLADAVAWFNSHGVEPSGVIQLSLAHAITIKMERRFNLRRHK